MSNLTAAQITTSHCSAILGENEISLTKPQIRRELPEHGPRLATKTKWSIRVPRPSLRSNSSGHTSIGGPRSEWNYEVEL